MLHGLGSTRLNAVVVVLAMVLVNGPQLVQPRIVTQHAPSVPRIPLHQLEAPGNEAYAALKAPFVLTHATVGWRAVLQWDGPYLAALFPSAVVDYYPTNLLKVENKPYLSGLQPSVDSMAKAARQGSPQYLQWRLRFPQMERLLKDMSPLPPALDSKWWLDACFPDPDHRNNFVRATQWNMVVVGNQEGSGMFMHQDGLSTATFQAQLTGRKEWVLCDPDRPMPPPGALDAFHPDVMARFPVLSNASCASVDVDEGEILLYPAHWWHQTKNHPDASLWSVGIASRFITADNRDAAYEEIANQCANPKPDISQDFPGASPNFWPEVCAQLENCRDVWRDRLVTGGFHT